MQLTTFHVKVRLFGAISDVDKDHLCNGIHNDLGDPSYEPIKSLGRFDIYGANGDIGFGLFEIGVPVVANPPNKRVCQMIGDFQVPADRVATSYQLHFGDLPPQRVTFAELRSNNATVDFKSVTYAGA
jgi:hypothetical protein